jgi:hypothetical protein
MTRRTGQSWQDDQDSQNRTTEQDSGDRTARTDQRRQVHLQFSLDRPATKPTGQHGQNIRSENVSWYRTTGTGQFGQGIRDITSTG